MSKSAKASAGEIETAIRQLTQPINGQYPRPWMTSLANPAEANVFTVGKNQRNGYNVADVGSHDHFIDTLFNRGSESCRALYNSIAGSPSPTRVNTDGLVRELSDRGVTKVIETNVICYSTPMSSDLRAIHNIGGAERGTEIFKILLGMVKPKVLISHGADTSRKLGKVLGVELPDPPTAPVRPQWTEVGDTIVFVIPSLAPPAFNKWSRWARDHLSAVSDRVADILRSNESSA